jgi:hypothetical protein
LATEAIFDLQEKFSHLGPFTRQELDRSLRVALHHQLLPAFPLA